MGVGWTAEEIREALWGTAETFNHFHQHDDHFHFVTRWDGKTERWIEPEGAECEEEK